MGCSSSSPSSEDDLKFEYLSASPFFLHLTASQLKDFSKHFRQAQFQAGSVIFEQGEAGAEFYLLGQGECDITLRESSDPNDTTQRFLCSKKPGDLFGEKGVLEENATRSATVTATEDCTLLMLTRTEFQSYMSTLDQDTQTNLRNVMGTKMLDSLKQIDFLKGLDDMRLGLLANVFRYVTVQAGEVIFSEGDLGRELYIISDGTVAVSAKSGGGGASSAAGEEKAPSASRASFIAAPAPAPAAIPIDGEASAGQDGIDTALVSVDVAASDVQFATLSPGQYFGEVSLMVDMPRTATVKAITRCLLLVLNAVDFGNFVRIVPGLKEKFSAVASARIAQQFRKFNVPFFQSIQEDRFQALSDLCKLEVFTKDSIICREGDIPQANQPAFYLLVSGRLVATKMDVGVVATLLPPSFLGEISLVTESPRTATIIADTRCVLLSLTKENFHSFFMSSNSGPDGDGAATRQYAEFSIKLSQRQVPLKPVLQHQLGHKLFAQHLALEYSSENLAFYDAAGLYESSSAAVTQADSSHDEAALLASSPKQVLLAEDIIQKYISSDAETQVNIPASIREECESEWRKGHVTGQLFVPARNEIFKLMSADSFKRFKASPLFQSLLDSVGSYGDKPTPALVNHRLSTHGGGGGSLQPQQPLPMPIAAGETTKPQQRHSVAIHPTGGQQQQQSNGSH